MLRLHKLATIQRTSLVRHLGVVDAATQGTIAATPTDFTREKIDGRFCSARLVPEPRITVRRKPN